MATHAHCAFCFETLVAHFEKRQPLGLAQVEELWEQYHTDKTGEGHEDSEGVDNDDSDMTEAEEAPAARPAAISRLLNRDPSAASSSSSLPSTRSEGSSTRSGGGGSGVDTPASSSSSRSSLLANKRRSDKNDAFPLFVTWNTISRSGNKNLRGCIGTFEAQPLEHGLASYSFTSAFEDTRFQPIPASLLPSLSNHVTLLTNFSQPNKDPLAWTLGQHGIRISFTYHSRRYGATYLPDVAKEQGWTKEETLVSLMRKAGWNGSSSSWLKTWRDGKGELITYEGKAVGLRFDEWRDWRNWVDVQGAKKK